MKFQVILYSFVFSIGLLSSCKDFRVSPEQNEFYTKFFGGPSIDDGNTIRSTSDGGVVIAGTTTNAIFGFEQAFIAKLDARGNTQWQYALGDTTTRGTSVNLLNDGGYILAANVMHYRGPADGVVSDIVLYKFNASGVMTAKKQFERPNNQIANDILEIRSGNFIGSLLIVGSDDKNADLGNTNSLVAYTSSDLTGVLEVTENSSGTFSRSSLSRVVSGTGIFYTMGTAQENSSQISAVSISKISDSGIEFNGSTETLEIPGQQTIAGDIIISDGKVFAVAYSNNAILLIVSENQADEISDALNKTFNTVQTRTAKGITVQGNIAYVGGEQLEGVNTDKLLMKINLTNYTIEETFTYGGPGDQTCNHITSTTDGGVVMIGKTSVEETNSMIEVVKVKANGTQQPD